MCQVFKKLFLFLKPNGFFDGIYNVGTDEPKTTEKEFYI